MSIKYQGSTTLPYYYSSEIGYGEGMMIMRDGLRQPIKIFKVDSGSLRKCLKEIPRLMEIKAKCSQIPVKSLLVPLFVEQDKNYRQGKLSRIIHLIYAFDYTFKESRELGLIPPVFGPANNGIIDLWWGEQTLAILDTVSQMHDCCLYHTDLCNVNKYVYLNKSICIVLPNLLCSSKDNTMEKDDLVALGLFFNGLVDRPSVEWNDFLQGFGEYPITVLRKHPVLKNLELRYEYLRALLTRATSAWDNDYEHWVTFRTYLKKYPDICPNWVSQIKEKDYRKVYAKMGFNLTYGSNFNLLTFVQNATKHADATKRTVKTFLLFFVLICSSHFVVFISLKFYTVKCRRQAFIKTFTGCSRISPSKFIYFLLASLPETSM